MNGWDQYIYHLHQRIEEQERTIQSMESRIQQLENNQQNQLNPQTVERIEYNFDQLKIENLDGTLHIGLSPDELKGIEDFAVPDNREASIKQQLVPELNSYLHENGEQIIREIAEQQHVPAATVDTHLLIEDMAKQLPERVAFHEAEAGRNKQKVHKEQLKSNIRDQIKYEIYHALAKYMEGNDQTNDNGSP